MIVFLLIMIFLALLVPGLLRGIFGLIGLAILVFIFIAATSEPGKPAETWHKDRYGYETYRSDKGETWKRDRYGSETWRSNRGEVCTRNSYGGGVTCK